MSRIGKKPIIIPDNVKVAVNGQRIKISGPLGELELDVNPKVGINAGEKEINLTIVPDGKFSNAIWGTMRALIANMIEGVTKGYSKSLELVGVGFKVSQKGNGLVLDIGFSHSVDFPMPEGVQVSVEKNTITVKGIDKQAVGEVASNIRKLKKPEPYKGKGIKYVGEVIRRKAGKAVKAAK